MSHRQAIGLGRTFADMERIVMSQPLGTRREKEYQASRTA